MYIYILECTKSSEMNQNNTSKMQNDLKRPKFSKLGKFGIFD